MTVPIRLTTSIHNPSKRKNTANRRDAVKLQVCRYKLISLKSGQQQGGSYKHTEMLVVLLSSAFSKYLYERK